MNAYLPIEASSNEGALDKAHDLSEADRHVTHAQQAETWEPSSAMSVAPLWRNQDRHRQAHHLLARIDGRFTEDGAAPLLTAVGTLAEQLAS